jgi:hypothetical protein
MQKTKQKISYKRTFNWYSKFLKTHQLFFAPQVATAWAKWNIALEKKNWGIRPCRILFCAR